MLTEYVENLSDQNLNFLSERLNQRLNGDLGDSLNYLEKIPEFDKWFASAENYNQLYNMIDTIQMAVNKEVRERMV